MPTFKTDALKLAMRVLANGVADTEDLSTSAVSILLEEGSNLVEMKTGRGVVSARVGIGTVSENTDPFDVRLPFSILSTAIRNIDEENLTLTVGTSKVTVSSGGFKLGIPVRNELAINYRSLKEEVLIGSVPYGKLKNWVKSVSWLVPDSSVNADYTCVYMVNAGSELEFVTTNQIGIAVQRTGIEIDDKFSMLAIPQEFVMSISRLGFGDDIRVGLYTDGSNLSIKAFGVEITTGLLSSKLPNYTKFITKSDHEDVVFDRKELLRTINRVESVANSNSVYGHRGIRFNPMDGHLRAEALGSALVVRDDELDVECSQEFRVNGKDMMRALNQFSSDEVSVSIPNDSRSTLIVSAHDSGLVYATTMVRGD